MAGKQRANASAEKQEGLRYEKLAFYLLVVFVFLIPTKFGLINLDAPPTIFPPIPNFINPMEQWPDEIGQVFIILIFLLWMMSMIARKKVIFRFSSASFFLWGFLIVGIISTTRSVVVHSSILHLKWFISYILLFHLVVNLADTEHRQKLLIGSFIVGTALVGIIGLYQHFYGLEQMIRDVYESIRVEQRADYLARIERGRIFSTFTYPNSLAGFLLISIPVLPVVFSIKREWLRKDNYWKSIAYLMLVVVPVLASFLLTESKGGFLTLGLMVIVGLFLAAGLFGLSKKIIIGVLVGIIIISAVVGISPVGKTLIEKGKYTFGERVQYWRAAVKMVPLRPVLGNGFFSFAPMYNKYRSPEANDTRTAHNNYLQILVETGILGLICFLGFWAAVCTLAIRSIIRGFGSDKALTFENAVTAAAFLGVLGFLLHNIVDFDLYVPGIALSAWFLAALMVRNSGAAVEHVVIFRKDSAVSTALIAVTAICLAASFLTVKTLWGASSFYLGYSIQKNPAEYPEYDDPYAQAEREFKNAIWWDRTNHNYHNHLGNLYLLRGQRLRSEEYIRKAIEAFDRAISLNRYNPVHRLHKTTATRELMELRGEIDTAELLKLWSDIVEHAPTASYYRVLYAEELRLAGKADEAVAEYEKALDLDPDLQNALQKARGRYNEPKLKQSIENLDRLMGTLQE